MPVRPFDRVYYATAAATIAGLACLPWLDTLSYRVRGYDPALAHSGTYAAFQARMATTSLRGGFLVGLLLLALCLVTLSIAALVLRVRNRTSVPWPLVALTTIGGAGVAMLALAGLVMQGGGMCC